MWRQCCGSHGARRQAECDRKIKHTSQAEALFEKTSAKWAAGVCLMWVQAAKTVYTERIEDREAGEAERKKSCRKVALSCDLSLVF